MKMQNLLTPSLIIPFFSSQHSDMETEDWPSTNVCLINPISYSYASGFASGDLISSSGELHRVFKLEQDLVKALRDQKENLESTLLQIK